MEIALLSPPGIQTRVADDTPATAFAVAGKRSGAMADFNDFLTQAHQLLETARTLDARSKRGGLEFVNTELDLSRTFAEGALALFSDGLVSNAKLSALVAREAFQTGRDFLPGLGVDGEQRELIDAKLANLTPLIEKLSDIR